MKTISLKVPDWVSEEDAKLWIAEDLAKIFQRR